ncbi:MAG: hypothetical protein IKJ63_03810 [Clostridia bacterium]|nr:hypothetical protein [Clostridia bacterium]
MNEIQEKIQGDLMKRYHRQLYLVLLGGGGVIFRCHFMKLLGDDSEYVLRMMIDHNIVKQKRVGKNFVIVLKHTVYCRYQFPNKNAKLTSKRLLHSALLFEMLIRTYGADGIIKMEKLLCMSNLPYYALDNSLNILTRIYSYLTYRGDEDLATLKWSIDRTSKKIEFMKQSTKGRKGTLERIETRFEDLLTLRSKGVYTLYASNKDDALELHFGIFAIGKGADKITEAITKAEKVVDDVFGGINIKCVFNVYSLCEKSERTEKKALSNLMFLKGNELKEEYYKENIRFYWYDCKNRLLSGIDVAKWL